MATIVLDSLNGYQQSIFRYLKDFLHTTPHGAMRGKTQEKPVNDLLQQI
jgi:hypothetical protein